MMEIIEKCMRSSDLSGLHALQSMWDCSDSSTFSSDRLLKSKKTLLMTASRLGHLECCKFLLSISMPRIDLRSKLGANLSVYRRYEHLPKYPHHLYLHLSRRNNVGFTALHYAAYHGHEDVVFLLLEAGADPKLLNNLNESVLDSAIAGNHTKLVKRLEGSRFLKKEIIFPGLFDFSSAFLSDLKERMESLPVDQTAVGVEKNNSTGDSICEKLAINDNSSRCSSSSSGSGGSRSSNCRKSRDDIKSAIGTNPGDDCPLSDGEVRDHVNLRIEQESKKAIKILEKNPTTKMKNKSEKRSHDDQDGNGDCNDVIDQNNDRKVCGFTRYEASKYYIKVTSVLEGGQENLINTETALLSSFIGATATDKDIKTSNNDYADTQNNNNNNNNKESKSTTDEFSIGRSRCNNYPLDDLSVSKKHAIISYYQGVGFILRDLKSKHGTFLDDVRLGIPDPGSSASNIKDAKEGFAASTAKGCSNKGFLLLDGSIVRFGRVICTVFKKRQSAVISSGPICFQPKSGKLNQAEESQDLCGKKRTALMALYGHYEKPDKGDKDNANAKKIVGVVVKPPCMQQTSMIQHQQQIDLQKQQEHHQQLSRQQLKQQEDDQVMHVGETLLRKMGWEGTAIGRSGAPAAKPLIAVQRLDRVGLGNGAMDSHSVNITEGHSQHLIVDSKKSTMRNKMVARFQNIL